MDLVSITPGKANNQGKINLTEAQKKAISKKQKDVVLKVIVSEL